MLRGIRDTEFHSAIPAHCAGEHYEKNTDQSGHRGGHLNNKIIEIGSSSDCREGSAQFFDKHYYVNEKEFTNIDQLRTEILPYFVDEKVKAISIDGISPE